MVGERFIVENAEITIVPIDEAEHYLDLLSDEDIAYIDALRPAARRSEIVSWRAAVRDRLGNVSIQYDDAGAPMIVSKIAPVIVGGSETRMPKLADNGMENCRVAKCRNETGRIDGANRCGAAKRSDTQKWHIGVTHSEKLAAVIFSPRRCAIDMENAARNFERAASRFISSEEAALPESGHVLFKAAVWCAKETLYKYSGRRGLDLLRDLKITASDIAGGKICGAILSPAGLWHEHTLRMMPYTAKHVNGKYIIVYLA